MLILNFILLFILDYFYVFAFLSKISDFFSFLNKIENSFLKGFIEIVYYAVYTISLSELIISESSSIIFFCIDKPGFFSQLFNELSVCILKREEKAQKINHCFCSSIFLEIR